VTWVKKVEHAVREHDPLACSATGFGEGDGVGRGEEGQGQARASS
jgi:hypothetical protein